MSLRSLFFLLILILVATFIGVNWDVMNQPTDLSLIFTHIHAPLGLVMMCLMVAAVVLLVLVMIYSQSKALGELRRSSKELAVQRELADKAEASRFTTLSSRLDQKMDSLTQTIDDQTREMLARVDRAETGLRDRPVDADVARLVTAVDQLNRNLHARVDRLEVGLREGLVDYTPASLHVSPASPAPVAHQPSADDPGIPDKE